MNGDRRPLQLTTQQFRALIGQAGPPAKSSGSLLETLSKLIPILAVIAGGAWTLHDYFEFKKRNDELTNQQLTLTNQQLELSYKVSLLTRESLDITNQLSKLKLQNSITGRINSSGETDVRELSSFDDGTKLFRFSFHLKAKNISDATVTIPMAAFTLWLADAPADALAPGSGFRVNDPPNIWSDGAEGRIKWTRLAAHINTSDKAPEDIMKSLSERTEDRGSGEFTGVLRVGQTMSQTLQYVVRARSDQMIGACVTYWFNAEGEDPQSWDEFRYEYLAEAEPPEADKAKKRESPREIARQ